ncbi:MAG: beta-ketoacyl-[acyl-carrier-protein] synthase family protein [Nitrospirota bacterium]
MIAITGIGAVSPTGTGKEKILRSLSESVSGISVSGKFGLHAYNADSFGEVKDFMPKDYIPPIKARRMSRFSQFALASAIEALRDSGLEINDENRFNTGIAVGTGLASTDSTDKFYEGLLKEGADGTNPMIFPETVQNIAASHISIHFGIKGPNITFSHSDISSELAIFYACELLKDNRADFVIVSGSDELSHAVVTGYSSLGLLSDRMMPFDLMRDGFVLAEGGATVILERLDDAKKRKADVYCKIVSQGFSSSPAATIKYDSSLGSMIDSMKTALLRAGTPIPDFISAAANSTRELDRLETLAIREVFGGMASAIPVSAVRSHYGFFQGDGVLRIALAALSLREGIIPKTLGLKNPSPECDLDYVADGPRNAEINSVLINSFSSGGSASSIVLGREN